MDDELKESGRAVIKSGAKLAKIDKAFEFAADVARFLQLARVSPPTRELQRAEAAERREALEARALQRQLPDFGERMREVLQSADEPEQTLHDATVVINRWREIRERLTGQRMHECAGAVLRGSMTSEGLADSRTLQALNALETLYAEDLLLLRELCDAVRDSDTLSAIDVVDNEHCFRGTSQALKERFRPGSPEVASGDRLRDALLAWGSADGAARFPQGPTAVGLHLDGLLEEPLDC